MHTFQRPGHLQVHVCAHNGVGRAFRRNPGEAALFAKSIQMHGTWSGCRISRVGKMQKTWSSQCASCNTSHTRHTRPKQLPWPRIVSSKTARGTVSSSCGLFQLVDPPYPDTNSQHSHNMVHNLTYCYHLPQSTHGHTPNQTTSIHRWAHFPYAILRQMNTQMLCSPPFYFVFTGSQNSTVH